MSCPCEITVFCGHVNAIFVDWAEGIHPQDRVDVCLRQWNRGIPACIAERLKEFENGATRFAARLGVGKKADAMGAANPLHSRLSRYEGFDHVEMAEHGR